MLYLLTAVTAILLGRIELARAWHGFVDGDGGPSPWDGAS